MTESQICRDLQRMRLSKAASPKTANQISEASANTTNQKNWSRHSEVQVLAEHVGCAFATPPGHAWPHPSQFLASPVVSTQVPPHNVGVACWQPVAHTWPAPDAAHTGSVDGHVVLRTRVAGDDPRDVGVTAANDLLDGKGGRALFEDVA